jgi:hypothetical protein
MILRGRVSNASAPVAYSAWNLPPLRPFSEFVSNPPACDGSLGLRVRPSSEDIEALIAPLRSLLEDEKQTHFEMSASTDDAEIDVVLSLLAGESSDSTHTEPMAIIAGQELGEEVESQKPEGARPKRPRRVSRPTAPVEEKRKKRQLRRLSCLDQGVGPSAPVPDDVPAEALPKVDAKGCDRARAAVCLFDEDEEEEEEEIPLIRKNNRHYRGSEGVVIFLLQLYRLLSVFRGFQYQTLIKYWRKSSPKTCYQSHLPMISRSSVERSQTVSFPCLIPLGKR